MCPSTIWVLSPRPFPPSLDPSLCPRLVHPRERGLVRKSVEHARALLSHVARSTVRRLLEFALAEGERRRQGPLRRSRLPLLAPWGQDLLEQVAIVDDSERAQRQLRRRRVRRLGLRSHGRGPAGVSVPRQGSPGGAEPETAASAPGRTPARRIVGPRGEDVGPFGRRRLLLLLLLLPLRPFLQGEVDCPGAGNLRALDGGGAPQSFC
mmetsp:Transcript_26758/g.64882  ORF Transcript_26758/g.64882 Transcript_26758/m.64882 type:complete len:208 (-) Transcript_26758:3380-4003(-)